jgi:hypothetical protein
MNDAIFTSLSTGLLSIVLFALMTFVLKDISQKRFLKTALFLKYQTYIDDIIPK